MEDMKSIVKYFVENLPKNSKFNLLEFGSTINWLFPQLVSSSDENKKKTTIDHLNKMKANYGGR